MSQAKPIISGEKLLNNEQIESMISDSITQFFSTMLSTPAEFIESEVLGSEEEVTLFGKHHGDASTPLVVAAIGFCGEIDGLSYLYFGEPLAQEITSLFLDQDIQEIREDAETVNDVLGELANMIIGTYKNKLCDVGYECRLTIPSIVRGSAFSIQTPSEVVRHCMAYRTLNRAFLIDLNIKQSES